MAGKIEDISDVEDRKSLRIEDFSEVVEGGRVGDMYDYDSRKKEDLTCHERPTMVFWNVIKCPIPPDALSGVKPIIRRALSRMGLHGSLLLYAYGDKSLLDQKDVFRKAGISYHVQPEQLSDADIEGEQKVADIEDSGEMELDAIMLADNTDGRPAILMAIPKPDQRSELHRVLKCLQSRDHDVLIVNPPVGGQFLESAESLVACIQGLDGEGGPITKPKCICADS